MKNSTITKERIIQEQNHRFHELCKQFEEYKYEFNLERLNKMSQDLFAANKKVEEVEKVNRETTKCKDWCICVLGIFLLEIFSERVADAEVGVRRFPAKEFSLIIHVCRVIL